MITRGHDFPFLIAPAVILLGCVALAIRPLAPLSALAVLSAVGALGMLAPIPSHSAGRTGGLSTLAAVIVGLLTFTVARAIAAPLPTPATPFAVGATVLAAVAEEIFFRRLVYGWLAGAGEVAAIVGAAALFAVVHVPAYGPRVLPLDLAAGLLFGWQRWATGGWIAPAVTHAAANVLQFL
jgi:membrane protease YdiL (CAAX protease family)